MAKTLLVCGYGPGISDAVARRFSAAGFELALVARDGERLERAAAGLTARAFPCDLSDPGAVAPLVSRVRAGLGGIDVIHWNAVSLAAQDLLTAPLAELRTALDVGVVSLVAAVQAAHQDLKAKKGAVLITGGGFSRYDQNVDAAAVQARAMGLSVTKAAQRKLAGLLHKRLAADGIYVGELVVLGLVKGTAFDSGQATLEASSIAAKFYELYSTRTEVSVNFSERG